MKRTGSGQGCESFRRSSDPFGSIGLGQTRRGECRSGCKECRATRLTSSEHQEPVFAYVACNSLSLANHEMNSHGLRLASNSQPQPQAQKRVVRASRVCHALANTKAARSTRDQTSAAPGVRSHAAQKRKSPPRSKTQQRHEAHRVFP